jgi:hypothetical protein
MRTASILDRPWKFDFYSSAGGGSGRRDLMIQGGNEKDRREYISTKDSDIQLFVLGSMVEVCPMNETCNLRGIPALITRRIAEDLNHCLPFFTRYVCCISTVDKHIMET